MQNDIKSNEIVNYLNKKSIINNNNCNWEKLV